MIIKKKTWPDKFQEILDGKKNFELRLGDFQCNEGDILVLEEYDPVTKKYTGRKIEKKIKYVLKTKKIPDYWTKEEIEKHGFQIISFDQN